MLTNQFFSGAAVAALIGSIAIQAKTLVPKIYDYFKKRVLKESITYATSELFYALELYIADKYPHKQRRMEATLTDSKFWTSEKHEPGMYQKKKVERKEVYLKHFADYFIVLFQGRPIIIDKTRDKLENASTKEHLFLESFRIKTLFGKTHLNNFLSTAYKYYEGKQQLKEFPTLFTNRWENWKPTKEIRKSMDSVVYSGTIKKDIIADLEEFHANKDLYEKLSIVHKRSYLFKGNPGSGKTSLAIALASHFKKDLYYMNLKSVSGDDTLQELFACIKDNGILLLEDIDVAVTGRDIDNEKVSFSGLINCLDGAFSVDGIVIIMTTNHPDKLDPALIRSGRADKIYTIDSPTKEQVEEYLKVVYGITIPVNDMSKVGSMADIAGLCLNKSAKEIQEYFS